MENKDNRRRAHKTGPLMSVFHCCLETSDTAVLADKRLYLLTSNNTMQKHNIITLVSSYTLIHTHPHEGMEVCCNGFAC